jgi:hypothetical protein
MTGSAPAEIADGATPSSDLAGHAVRERGLPRRRPGPDANEYLTEAWQANDIDADRWRRAGCGRPALGLAPPVAASDEFLKRTETITGHPGTQAGAFER